MWLSLVERLLWEQDAAGSNPVIRTTQRELTLAVGSLCVFRAAAFGLRHRASKASCLLWAKCLSAAGGEAEDAAYFESCHPTHLPMES